MGKKHEMVVEGAKMKCTMGDQSTSLKVTSNLTYKIDGKNVATILDFMPGTNLFPPIATFGTCKPFKALPPPGPLCTPILAGPWQKPFDKKTVGGKSPLKGDSCHMCTRGAGKISFEDTGQNKVIEKKHTVECKQCGKIHNPELTEAGTNVGNGQILAKALMKFKYGGLPASKHPLSTGPKSMCAQAHHLICSESVDDEEWSNIFNTFGYDINCKENGIFLPADMSVACELEIPLHKGDHSSTETHIVGMNYVDAVKGIIESIKAKAKRKGYCEPNENKTIISDLNSKSKSIWQNVKSFSWTISSDGSDYSPGGIGCSGASSIPEKTGKACPAGRKHGHQFKILPLTYFLEQ